MTRRPALLALILLLAGCASRPPPAAEPEAVVEEAPPDTVVVAVEPEIPLAERVRSPFAVQRSGSPAPRPRRMAAVVRDTTARAPGPEVAATETDTAAARTIAATPDTAAPERPAPADTGTRAEQQPARTGTTATNAPAAGATTPERRTAVDTPPAAPPASPPAASATRPAAPPAAPARAQPREHRVAAGETLLGIARRYGVSYTALLNTNPGIDPDRLRPEQVIRIPAGGATTAGGGGAAARSGTSTARPANRTRTHTVTQGETLTGIARRYGISVAQLRAANRLQSDTIRPGQRLTIPTP